MYKCLLLWLCGFSAAYCQTGFLTGQLIDRESKEPIPFAHLRLIGTNEGFISNVDGHFRYQPLLAISNCKLFVSAIGYQSDTLEMIVGVSTTLMLSPSKTQLKEVVVVPKDYERDLLMNAITAIPLNYPDHTEQIIGEIWEKGYKDSLYTHMYYEASAKIEATKADYRKASTFGPVRFLGGTIQTEPDYDNLHIRISAGIHNVHRFDFVLQRLGPLDPSKLKNYSLEIVDTLRIDDTELYNLRFEGKDYYGHLLIADGSFAILRGEFNEQPEKLDATIGYTRRFLRFTTEYTPFEGRYRISYINYRTAFDHKTSDERFYLDNVFSLTHFSDTPTYMPLNEQVSFSEILSLKLLGENAKLELLDTGRMVTSVQTERQIKQAKKYAFISKIYSQLSVNIAPISIREYAVNTPGASFAGANRSLVQYRIATETGYKFSNTFKLALISEINPDTRSFNGLQARWDIPLNRRQTVRTAVALGAGYGMLREKIGTFTPAEAFEIRNRTFSTQNTELYLETRALEITPSVRILMQVTPRLFISFTGNYWNQASTTNGVYLIQDNVRRFTSSFLDGATNRPLVRHTWSAGIGVNWSL